MDEQIINAKIADLKERIEANGKEAIRLADERDYCVAAHKRAEAAGNQAEVVKNGEHWQSVSHAQAVNGRQREALQQEAHDLSIEIGAEAGREIMDILGGGS